MCGIVGYIGAKDAEPILLDGLKRLEYRGYDSAGMATVGDGMHITKSAGKIAALEEKLKEKSLVGSLGIAHTRWATHGAPTDINAHPHTDCEGDIAIVHNGIIENYRALRELLEREGHTFRSDTDTEIIAHLIEKHYSGENLEEAVRNALLQMEGAYGMVVISSHEPNKLVVARNGSPLVIGVKEGEYFVASDAAALLPYTRRVIYLDDGEMAVVSSGGYKTMTLDKKEVTKEIEQITWDLEMIEKGGFPHFMLKEIFEQPQSIESITSGKIKKNSPEVRLRCLTNGFSDQVKRIDSIKVLACGTSWHAGLVASFSWRKFYGYRSPVSRRPSLGIDTR